MNCRACGSRKNAMSRLVCKLYFCLGRTVLIASQGCTAFRQYAHCISQRHVIQLRSADNHRILPAAPMERCADERRPRSTQAPQLSQTLALESKPPKAPKPPSSPEHLPRNLSPPRHPSPPPEHLPRHLSPPEPSTLQDEPKPPWPIGIRNAGQKHFPRIASHHI